MRLTAELKYKMLNDALERSNEKKARDDAYKALSDFAVRVITEYHGEDNLKALEADAKKMHELAGKLADLDLFMRLNRTQEVGFSFASEKPLNKGNNNYYDIILENSMYCARHIWINSTPLAFELRDLMIKLEKSRRALNDLRSTISSVLNSVTTVKKLLAVWEEAAELLPVDTSKPKVILPMLDTTSLNKSLNLPTK